MGDETCQWEGICRHAGRASFEPGHPALKLAADLLKYGLRSLLGPGCGSGRHLIHKAHKGLQLTGPDLAPTALKLTREWLDEEGPAAGELPPCRSHISHLTPSFPPR